MKKIFSLTVLFTFLFTDIFGQDIKDFILKGNNLYDNGKYEEAIIEYQHALSIDNNSAAANLEMANTLIALQKYQRAIEYSDKIIQLNGSYVDQAYTAKGTALDLMGKPDAAIETYKTGIKKFPDNYLLHYNASLTFLKLKQYNEASYYSAKAVESNPKHSSSHIVLANCMFYLGKRTQSLMALYYFLYLEPNSKRSAGALEILMQQLKMGVSREDEKNTTITVSEKDTKDEFGPVNLALSLMEASKNIDKNKAKSDEQLFFETTELFFDVLNKTDESERKKSIWWNVYVPLFHDITSSNNTEAFSYFILKSKNTAAANKWITTHKDKTDKFSKWRDAYLSKK